MYEEEENRWRCSFRSDGKWINVNELLQAFCGGGHAAPRCRSFALSSKIPGRYALLGPSRCPCINFRTGRSTLFSTGSSWSAGRPPCAKCSLFRVKSSAITPFPVLRSVIYPADSSFVRLRHTVCRLIDVKPNEENEINYVYRCTIHALHSGEPGAGRLSDRCAGVFAG